MTIYLDWIGGRWESFFYSEGSTLRFHSWNRAEAVAKAVRASGYGRDEVKVVRIDKEVPR